MRKKKLEQRTKMSTGLPKPGRMAFNFAVNLFNLLRRIGGSLFIVTVIGTTLDQWITSRMESLLLNPEGTSSLVWAYGSISLLLNLIYPLIGILLVISCWKDQPFFLFLKNDFGQNLKEQMRAWGQAMLWTFVLIIPGLIRLMQFSLVPFVVSLDPAYQRGEKDALKTARQLSQRQWGKLFFLFFIFNLVLPAILTLADEWSVLWKTPLPALIICFVEMLLNLCFILGLYKIFQRGTQHESPVPMEGH
jgi:hypothetical protein